MMSSPPFSRPSLLLVLCRCLLFLSLFNIAAALSLPRHPVKGTLPAPLGSFGSSNPKAKPITEDEYIAFLLKFFPATDKYLFYTGGAQDQLKAFQKQNPDYLYYENFFNPDDMDHPWFDHFDDFTQVHDIIVSSKAMARVATKNVLVFGAAEYMTKGSESYYTLYEDPILKDRVRTGDIKSIDHMALFATRPGQTIAKEDATGTFTWQPGYTSGTTNASPPCTAVDNYAWDEFCDDINALSVSE